MLQNKLRIQLNMQNDKCQIAYLTKYPKWRMPNCVFSQTCKIANAELHI